jgi:hypothetical protein
VRRLQLDTGERLAYFVLRQSCWEDWLIIVARTQDPLEAPKQIRIKDYAHCSDLTLGIAVERGSFDSRSATDAASEALALPRSEQRRVGTRTPLTRVPVRLQAKRPSRRKPHPLG